MDSYTITGIEKVRDVIQAADSESAEKLFRAKYPAVYKILDIDVMGYPEFVAIERKGGTVLCRSRAIDHDSAQRRSEEPKVGQPYYWRDAGQWGIHAKKVGDQLLIDCPDLPHLHNTPLIEVSREEWVEDNEGYL